MKYLIANWKANKTIDEADQWLDSFLKKDFSLVTKKVQIIICPPHPFLLPLKNRVKKYPFIKISAQDVSFFKKGQYTGEVSVENLSSLADYVIIGHSERRYYFAETERILFQKFSLAKKNNIEPIFCLRDGTDLLPARVRFIAYEPVYAIGTGDNVPVNQVLRLKKVLTLTKEVKFIYGGSVNENNASSYLREKEIDGLLVGTASLDEKKFYAIVTSCA